jgi:hypothetical protein
VDQPPRFLFARTTLDVIPGQPEGLSPESITTVVLKRGSRKQIWRTPTMVGYGFRARLFEAPRNDIEL